MQLILFYLEIERVNDISKPSSLSLYPSLGIAHRAASVTMVMFTLPQRRRLVYVPFNCKVRQNYHLQLLMLWSVLLLT